MEKRINDLRLCEKLAGCPRGTKLWSPLFGECEFLGLSKDLDDDEPDEDQICVHSDEMGSVTFETDGRFFTSSEECLIFPSKDNRDWSTWVNPKPKSKVERFDPKTLKPFDRVLARDDENHYWKPAFLSSFNSKAGFPIALIGIEIFARCIPYNEETEHLANTKNEAPEYYRWWEDTK